MSGRGREGTNLLVL